MSGLEEWPSGGLEALGRCPVCGGERRSVLHRDLTDRVFFCAPGTWTLHRCAACGCAYLDPRPTPETIGLAYAAYYTHDAVPDPTDWSHVPTRGLEGLRWALRAGYLNRRYGYSFRPAIAAGRLIMPLFPRAKERADRWARHLRRPSPRASLLDVGCGHGWFLREMRVVGWSVVGLDPDPEAVKIARASGIQVHEGLLEEDSFPEASFDAVTLNHVIEHLHDPLGTLRVCRKILRPGGFIWIGTPNLASRGHALFRRDWRGLEPPRHLVLFTPESLARALAGAGFEVVRRPTVRVATWMFRQSLAISRGLEPMRDPPALPQDLAWRARWANLRTLWQTGVAEEAIVLARRPPD